MSCRWTTLRGSVRVAGRTLHDNAKACVVLRPSKTPQITFRHPRAHATIANTTALHKAASHYAATTLGAPPDDFRTVEHLLAALSGCGVDGCDIETAPGELPILDGSAAPWVAAIRRAGLETRTGGGEPRAPLSPRRSVRVSAGESFAIALPAPAPRLTVGIDFAHARAIGRQWASWAPEVPLEVLSDGPGSFAAEVAPARTFATAGFVRELRAAGLACGGTLENALVCDGDDWLNGPLRFANEPARHKLLDLLGDLALVGPLPHAHVVAFR